MTPQEKAQDLFNKYYAITGPFTEAKQCALIAVDEIIAKHYDDWDAQSEYWMEVKQEIEKL